MPSYDPLSSKVTVDATINAIVYIVTAFTRNGAGAVGPDFSKSNGSYRGQRKVSGPEDASMTIEVTDDAEDAPEQFDTFTYDGTVWVIQTVGLGMSSTGAATRSLSLRAQTAEELAALTP
jgi:hypothetical protein